jgi:hypothetical protein
VTVTVATERGWALVGVLGGAGTAAEAVAQIGAQGLDASVRPLATGSTGGSRLTWLGESRSPRERHAARELAAGRVPSLKPSRPPSGTASATAATPATTPVPPPARKGRRPR